MSARICLRQEFSWIDSQCFGNLAKDRERCRHLCTLNGTDMARTQACAMGQFFLRQFLAMADTTQIPRHDLVEIHDISGNRIGTIVLGTIVPIQQSL